MIKLIIFMLIAYLIGSIPTGFIVVKLLKNEDIRNIGSGSTGATNVKRVLGTKWFFIVMVLDALKGAVAVLISGYWVTLLGHWGLGPVAGGIAVLIGHSKSIFLNFTGGKSVATGIGTILALCWPVGLITAVVWALLTYVSKYVSLGSIIALMLSPLLMMSFHKPVLYTSYCALGAAYVVFLHRDNIKRLFAGEENKIR